MKKILVTGMMMCLLMIAIAQAPVKQSIRITAEQVPLAVQQAYEKDFGALPEDGYWTVYTETKPDGARTAAKPLWYCYTKRSKSEKIELRFLPTGELTSAKGIDKTKYNLSDSIPIEKKKIGR
ncbi:MAG TPA: hypothetical protein VIN08_15270 [Ohtaekwangia sp.]|uniref:hypothetical protein n=1 Tax=Ohtaekwangia sp. TaxID=2066019 RepID=UPI002F93CA55